MQPTVIMVDEVPKAVVRPTDKKDLDRFIRNSKKYFLADNEEGKVTHRPADDAEVARWKSALGLHLAWGGPEENFFGIPL